MANPVILMIKLEDGQLGVQGPLENKVLILGMLELAKAVVLNADQEKKSDIVVPPMPNGHNPRFGIVN